MEETTNAIPGYIHTHGIYGHGRNDDGILVDLINKNDINNTVRAVGADVTNGTSSVKDAVRDVNQNVTAGNYTTLTGLNALGRDVSDSINHQGSDFMNAMNSANIATLTGFNNTNIATLTGFNNTNGQLTQGFNQSFIQSKDILASIAECCCEIKERFCETDKLILSENQATRSLITDNRMHELEEKLTEARLQNSQSTQTAAILAALGSNGPGNSGK